MYLRTLPQRGMPPRGSLADQIAMEMIRRERRETISKQVYVARILAASAGIPNVVFQLWTSLYTMDVTHETYTDEAVASKQEAVALVQPDAASSEDQQRLARVALLELSEEDARPATDAEMEAFKQRLRRRHLRK